MIRIRTPTEADSPTVIELVRQFPTPTKKTNRYRFAYYGIVGVAAVGSALVPALINLELGTLVPTIIALVVAAAVALEGVFHTREHWRNYDLISSFLREEEMRFSTKTEPYSTSGQEKENDEVFKKFVERVENAIAKERAETIEMRTTKPESRGTSGQ